MRLLVVEDVWADRKEALNRLLGRDLLVAFSVEPVATALPAETALEAARTLALARRPEIKIAAIKRKQARLETRIEKTRYLPDIAIQANYLTPGEGAKADVVNLAIVDRIWNLWKMRVSTTTAK